MAQQVDDKFIAEFRRMKRWIAGFKIGGDGVTGKNGPEGAAYIVQQVRSPATPVGAKSLIVRPKSNASGSGWYAGKVMIPATTASDPTTAFSSTQVGTEGADCYIANLWEEGRSGHALLFSGVLPLEFPVVATLASKSDGTVCYLICGRQSSVCGV